MRERDHKTNVLLRPFFRLWFQLLHLDSTQTHRTGTHKKNVNINLLSQLTKRKSSRVNHSHLFRDVREATLGAFRDRSEEVAFVPDSETWFTNMQNAFETIAISSTVLFIVPPISFKRIAHVSDSIQSNPVITNSLQHSIESKKQTFLQNHCEDEEWRQWIASN